MLWGGAVFIIYTHIQPHKLRTHGLKYPVWGPPHSDIDTIKECINIIRCIYYSVIICVWGYTSASFINLVELTSFIYIYIFISIYLFSVHSNQRPRSPSSPRNHLSVRYVGAFMLLIEFGIRGAAVQLIQPIH